VDLTGPQLGAEAVAFAIEQQQGVITGRLEVAFVGYGAENETAVLELTWNWGTSKYEIGTAYGHIALGVDDIYATCADLKQKGVKVVREPGPMKHGSTPIAFIEDPNGYKIELIQQK